LSTVVVCGAAAVVLLAGCGAASIVAGGSNATIAARSVPAGLAGRDWYAIPTRARVVALTFDAGANAAGVKSILATLSRNHVRATVFLTAAFAKSFPRDARAIAAAGERLGNHSVSHPNFTKLSSAQIRAQVLSAQAQIIKAAGADPWPWFRFPYGDRDRRTIAAVNAAGFAAVGWTIDTLGWKGTSGGITTATVVRRVVAKLRPGEIVLMHCGSNPKDHTTLDARALPALISELRKRGYTFVTLDALRAAVRSSR
jgi:peptidoglycan/xylan/chitin deacetylase (PgdA/CDA1 family)